MAEKSTLTVLFPKFFTLQLKYADLPTNAVTYKEKSEKNYSHKFLFSVSKALFFLLPSWHAYINVYRVESHIILLILVNLHFSGLSDQNMIHTTLDSYKNERD